VFARDVAKANSMTEQFNVRVSSLDELHSNDARVLINATPVGMHGHSEGRSPVSRDIFKGRVAGYDLIYSPAQTQFLSDAESHGCLTLNGVEMLITQAAAQFELWTGNKAPVEVMRKACLAKIAADDRAAD